MIITDLIFTDKWKAVLADNSQVLLLEGPSQVSKTTLAGVKLVYEAMKSQKGKTVFFLAGESTPTLYRNFIEPETSITKLFPHMCKHVGGGSGGGQRIEVHVSYNGKIEVKKIFFVGYSDKTSGNKILGSTPYLLMADEVNKANDQFVKDMMTRVTSAGTRIIATTNGDSPDKLFYKYFNACRPPKRFIDDVPPTTLSDMLDVKSKDGWTYYYFRLDDRPSATAEWVKNMYSMHPMGSFEYNSKVLGIRSAVDGILYGHLFNKFHTLAFEKLNLNAIHEVIVGIDVGSGAREGSTAARTIFTVTGYSRGYQRAVILDGVVSEEIGHVETVQELNLFLDKWVRIFAHKVKEIRVDDAEPALIATCVKMIRWKHIRVMRSIKRNKQVTGYTRVSLKEQLIYTNRMLFLDNEGAQFIKAQLAKVKGLNGVTIDDNELHNDVNDSVDYTLTPRYGQLKEGKG